MSFHDVASALSETIGKEATYINVPNEALVDSMTEMALLRVDGALVCRVDGRL